MHPEELFATLAANAGARKKKNLEIIHAVCQEQFTRGSKDFSVATISRLSVERGGPAKSTIYNKTGSDFQALIRAWATHTGGALKKPPKRAAAFDYTELLMKIPEPSVRALVGAALAENKKLRRELSVLKSTAEFVVDRRQQAITITEGIDLQPQKASAYSCGLTDLEIEALRHAVSDQALVDEGWIVDDYGRVVVAKNGRPVFKVGFVDAIKKVLDQHREQS